MPVVSANRARLPKTRSSQNMKRRTFIGMAVPLAGLAILDCRGRGGANASVGVGGGPPGPEVKLVLRGGRSFYEVNVAEITDWSQTSTWQGLQIFDTTVIDDNKAYVSFEAQFTQQGKEQNHREKSLFEREGGKWRFVTGGELKNPTVRYETPRPGRNEPCPCGSGKKYKKCCGL